MATCKNLEGSYECGCNAGWEGSGIQCSDVNECDDGTAACHSRADCTNTEGSYLCSCQDGFIGDGTTCSGWYLGAPTISYKVKRQYVQISNIIDTSIKHPISCQPVKGCMFDMVDTALSYYEHWSSANFFKNLPQ